MKPRRYYAIVLGFDGRRAHFSFQIAYHEKDACIKTRYWGLRIEPGWPPVVWLKGERKEDHGEA